MQKNEDVKNFISNMKKVGFEQTDLEDLLLPLVDLANNMKDCPCEFQQVIEEDFEDLF